MKGRPFTINQQPIDGVDRIEVLCGNRRRWLHPDLVEKLDAGTLEGFDENGEKAIWVRRQTDDSVVADELEPEPHIGPATELSEIPPVVPEAFCAQTTDEGQEALEDLGEDRGNAEDE